MKKVLILALCLLALLGSIYFGAQATNGVRPGMTFDELYERGDFFIKMVISFIRTGQAIM